MRPLSSVGVALTLVSGILLLALIAELCYLLWWKKKRVISNRGAIGHACSAPARKLLCLLRWKKPSTCTSAALDHHELCSSVKVSDESSDDGELQISSSSSKDHLLKPFEGEDSLQAELMRLHGLSGPARFLFTIKEETKEDLESEDSRSRGGRSRKGSRGGSLGDLLLAAETPFLTPISSPPFFTPPLTPLDCYSQHGFNPLFESSKEDEFSKIRSNSPPPKFKFLRDAEDKLYRKTLMEEALRVHKNGGFVGDVAKQFPPVPSSPRLRAPAPSPPQSGSEEEDGSFITIIIGKHRERGHHQHQHHPGSSQVIPLASSPSNVRPPHERSISNLGSKQ